MSDESYTFIVNKLLWQHYLMGMIVILESMQETIVIIKVRN